VLMFRKKTPSVTYENYFNSYVMISLNNDEGALRGYLTAQNGPLLVLKQPHYVPNTPNAQASPLDCVETVVERSKVLFIQVLSLSVSIDEV
jgi:hypothetical protein